MEQKRDRMVSRRDFIKGAAAGAAGIAAMGLLGACTGNEDSTSSLHTSDHLVKVLITKSIQRASMLTITYQQNSNCL